MSGTFKATAISCFAIAASVGAAFATDVSKGTAMQPQPIIATPAAPAPAPTFWNGAYVGGMLGMGSANYKFSGSITDPQGNPFASAELPDFGGMGPLWGLQAGYNWRFSPEWVLGAQIDGSMTNIKHSANFNFPPAGASGTYDLKLRHEIALTARAGYVVEERTMIYGLVGASRARFEGDLNATDGVDTFSTDYSFNRTGWTVGLGISTMMTDNVSFGLEYRYTDYGRETIYNGPLMGGSADLGFDTKVQTVRAGVNYHF